MTKKINCIMLVDDNHDDNFIHERVIRKSGVANYVVSMDRAKKALEYLQLRNAPPNGHPDIILLDINMPEMNGWEFLEEYDKLDKELQSRMIVVMLTTSNNPDDKAKALSYGMVADFKTKPLTVEMINDIVIKYAAICSK